MQALDRSSEGEKGNVRRMKERLFTPGPTTIPIEIIQAMSIPALHHRTDTFKALFRRASEETREFLESEADPIFLAASGTGAMEAALINLCSPGDRIVSVVGGVFGGRWKKIADRIGVSCDELLCAWGDVPTTDALRKFLAEHSDARAFCIQQCETSTTTLFPLTELLSIVRELLPETIIIVDAISSCGAVALPRPRSLIDVYITGSQKALMLPPGLSFLSISSRAWTRIEMTPRRSLYFDLLIERDALRESGTAWTPAITIIAGLVRALELLKAEGIEAVFNRHLQMSRALQAALRALHLQVASPAHSSPTVTGFFPPPGIDAEEIRNQLKRRFGLRTAGGQGAWKGRVVRIGHMGHVDTLDLVGVVAAIESVLATSAGRKPDGRALVTYLEQIHADLGSGQQV
jgi:serine---pyruvate transaminase